MSILIICLFIACLLAFVSKFPVAYAQHQLGGYDNNHPRAQQANLTGFGARALAAHQNSFESLIFFTPAVVLAITTANTGEVIQNIAITHVVARVIYNALYLINIGMLRSLVWGIGFVCSLSIIWLCIPNA